MGKEKIKTSVRKIWTFFASVKLAVIIFILIALASIIGTVLIQNVPPEETIKQLNSLFGEDGGPSIYNVLDFLGFTHTYSSWWYMALLALLGANIIVCSLDRLPNILKIIHEPMQPHRTEHLTKMVISKSAIIYSTPAETKGVAMRAFRRAGFHCDESKEDKGWQFYAQKGRWSRLGVYITHFSILVILLGAIIKLNFSENSFLYLPEGYTSEVTVAFPGTTKEGESTLMPLGFEIHGDNFEVEFYGDTTEPKSYKSLVTILDNGKEVLQKIVEVNDPLIYRGTKFHLADYGMVPGKLPFGTFVFRVTPPNGLPEEVRLEPGQTLTIPNTSIIGKIINFSPALRHEKEGILITYDDRLYNPAVEIEFSDSGESLYTSWLFKRYPERGLLPDGNRVEFLDYWGVEYTYFLVRKDPSVWLVYFGLTALLAGLFAAFYLSHKRIWVHFTEEGPNTRMILGATANKNRTALEKKIDRLLKDLGK